MDFKYMIGEHLAELRLCEDESNGRESLSFEEMRGVIELAGKPINTLAPPAFSCPTEDIDLLQAVHFALRLNQLGQLLAERPTAIFIRAKSERSEWLTTYLIVPRLHNQQQAFTVHFYDSLHKLRPNPFFLLLLQHQVKDEQGEWQIGGMLPAFNLNHCAGQREEENYCDANHWAAYSVLMFLAQDNFEAVAKNHSSVNAGRKLRFLLSKLQVKPSQQPFYHEPEKRPQSVQISETALKISEQLQQLEKTMLAALAEKGDWIDLVAESQSLSTCQCLSLLLDPSQSNIASKLKAQLAENQEAKVRSQSAHQSTTALHFLSTYPPLEVDADIYELAKSPFFVDKSLFIMEALRSHAPVLITRPRGWNKTCNLALMKEFLSIRTPETIDKKQRDLFCGSQMHGYRRLKISHQLEAMDEFGKWPVVHLKLSLNINTAAPFLSFYKSIRESFEEHQQYLLPFLKKLVGTRSKYKQRVRRFQLILSDNYQGQQQPVLRESLYNLVEALFEYWKKKVYVLIDDFDAPFNASLLIQSPQTHKQLCTFQNALIGMLKDNKFVKNIIAFGRQPLYQPEIDFIHVRNISQDYFGSSFGFTEEDINSLFQRTVGNFDWVPLKRKIRHWYGGYNVGGESIYSPLSVLTYLSLDKQQKTLQLPFFEEQQKLLKFSLENVHMRDRNREQLKVLVSTGKIAFQAHHFFQKDNVKQFSQLATLLFWSGFITEVQQRSIYQFRIANNQALVFLFQNFMHKAMKKGEPLSQTLTLLVDKLDNQSEFVKTLAKQLEAVDDTIPVEEDIHAIIKGLTIYASPIVYKNTSFCASLPIQHFNDHSYAAFYFPILSLHTMAALHYYGVTKAECLKEERQQAKRRIKKSQAYSLVRERNQLNENWSKVKIMILLFYRRQNKWQIDEMHDAIEIQKKFDREGLESVEGEDLMNFYNEHKANIVASNDSISLNTQFFKFFQQNSSEERRNDLQTFHRTQELLQSEYSVQSISSNSSEFVDQKREEHGGMVTAIQGRSNRTFDIIAEMEKKYGLGSKRKAEVKPKKKKQ